MLTHLSSVLSSTLPPDQIIDRRQQAVAELRTITAQLGMEPESVEHVEDAFHTLSEIAILTPRISAASQ